MKNVGTQQFRASQRLSSGLRINSAADDAAGLGISEKMRAQIRGLDQASRNAQDGISLIQTAEGAMSTINEMVIRVRKLVVQAANDTNAHNDASTLTLAQSDRVRIQDELNQLMDEIDATRDRAQFNTRNLIDGSLSSSSAPATQPTYANWQAALGAGNIAFDGTLEVLLNRLHSEGRLDFGAHANARAFVENSATGFSGLNPLGAALDQLNNWAAAFGEQNNQAAVTSWNTFVSDFVHTPGGGGGPVTPPTIGGSLAELGGTGGTQTLGAALDTWAGTLSLAQLNTLGSEIYGGDWVALTAAATPGDHNIATGEIYIDNVTSLADVLAVLNTSPGGVAGTAGGTSAATIDSIFDNYLAYAPGLQAALDTWAQGAVDTAGANFTDWADFIAYNTGAGGAGDTRLNQMFAASATVGNSLRNTIQEWLLGGETGDHADILGRLNELHGALGGPGATFATAAEANTFFGTTELSDITADDLIQALVDQGSSFVDIASWGSTGAGSLAEAMNDWAGLQGEYADFAEWSAPHMIGEAAPGRTGNALWFQIGANARQGVRLSIEDVGVNALSRQATVGPGPGQVREGFTFADLRTSSELPGSAHTLGEGVLRVSGEDISEYINAIDLALAHVTGQRSELGAMQNRLEFTIQNLDISSENLSAAESRIRDADMAREMMNLTKTNVLQQAATSMLAQANQAPMTILQLLR